MVHVPAGRGVDKKTGDEFTYGNFDISLVQCETKGCGGVFCDLEQHAGTTPHKAALAALAG